jgi:hypothetical protein
MSSTTFDAQFDIASEVVAESPAVFRNPAAQRLLANRWMRWLQAVDHLRSAVQRNDPARASAP